MYRSILVSLFLIYPLNLAASDSTEVISGEMKFSAYLSGRYCYPGYSITPGIEMQTGNHILSLGPAFMLSDFYIPGDVTVGINTGWRYHFYDYPAHLPLSFFLAVDYQLIPYTIRLRPQNREQTNYIHNINIGYGIRYRLMDNLTISNSVSSGMYIESYYNRYTNKHENISGFDTLIQLTIVYALSE